MTYLAIWHDAKTGENTRFEFDCATDRAHWLTLNRKTVLLNGDTITLIDTIN